MSGAINESAPALLTRYPTLQLSLLPLLMLNALVLRQARTECEAFPPQVAIKVNFQAHANRSNVIAHA